MPHGPTSLKLFNTLWTTSSMRSLGYPMTRIIIHTLDTRTDWSAIPAQPDQPSGPPPLLPPVPGGTCAQPLKATSGTIQHQVLASQGFMGAFEIISRLGFSFSSVMGDFSSIILLNKHWWHSSLGKKSFNHWVVEHERDLLSQQSRRGVTAEIKLDSPENGSTSRLLRAALCTEKQAVVVTTIDDESYWFRIISVRVWSGNTEI